MNETSLTAEIETLLNDFTIQAKITNDPLQIRLHEICLHLLTLTDKQKAQNAVHSIIKTGLIILQDLNLDFTSVIGYSLHVALKESIITIDEIKQIFHPDVVQLVDGLQKISKLDTAKYSNHTDNFIKLLLTISDDLRVILIKLAERVYQMRNINSYDDEFQKKIATEASELYTPIAHRIGLYKIKSDFEDLCMQYLSPDKYNSIKEKLSTIQKDLDTYIADFIAPLNVKLLDNGINCSVFGRVKSVPSIWKKMQAQAVEFDKVYDLFAIRIIINCEIESEKADCWKAYSLVTEEYTPNPKRLRDWITVPKSSGYESLHTTVIGPEGKWVEVQIRTKRMNEIAEKGFASHWRYKDQKKNQSQTELFSLIREALEKPASSKNSTSKEKKQLYTDEIYVFTPKGDLKKLHSGYTVLDFAYEIHSDIGSACTGAVVNDKMVPLKHVLFNGDTIKIITTKNQKPNHSWLDFVNSPKAISKIKHTLKAEEFKDADEGKEIIKHKFENFELEFNDINLNKLATFYKCENTIEMYQLMGEGKLDATKIRKALLSTEKEESSKQSISSEPENTFSNSKATSNKSDYLQIDNQSASYGYMYSQCCNPVPGDKIFAFVTVTKGIKIHKTNCPNARELIIKFPYRVIEAQWKNISNSTSFTANLKISGHNTLGIANKITKLISNELHLNMRSIKIEELPGNRFEGTIGIYINSIEHLNKVIARIKKIKEVVSVQKLD